MGNSCDSTRATRKPTGWWIISRRKWTAFERNSHCRISTGSEPTARPAIKLLTAGMAVGKIQEGTLNLPSDYEFVRVLTKSPLKFTCTGPHMLSRVLTNCYYNDVADLAMDLAGVLRRQIELIEADVVQLDEACIVGFPQDAPWAAEAINHALDGVLNEKAVHICFGNYGGQPMLKGFWRDLIPFLNSLRVDHLVLEFARRRLRRTGIFFRPGSEDQPGDRPRRHQGQRSGNPRTDRVAHREHRGNPRA